MGRTFYEINKIMKLFNTKYIKELFTLALPIIMGNLGLILLGAGDCFVAGRYSTEAVAAISIATAIHATVAMFGIGLMFGISPLLSNKRGAREGTKKYFFPSIRFALIVGIIMMLVTLAYIPLLDYLGLEPKLLSDVKTFTFIVAFSMIGGQINVTIKEFLQSYEIVFLPNLLLLLSVFLNIVLNFVFVYGYFGLPQMGVAGIALSTTFVRTILAIVFLSFCLIKFNFKNYVSPDYFKQLTRIGIPISTAIITEFISFNYIAIILGRISGVYAAAHNIILVLCNASFMIPMGISNALAVKVGYYNGAKDYGEMIKFIKNGIGISMLIMSCAGVIFGLFPRQLIGIFTADNNLINISVPVMYIVALFQLSDGMQAALGGIYKGLKKTKFVMISNFISYIVIGISLGTFLGIFRKMYLFGCWIAIAISSLMLASILLVWLYFILKKNRINA